MLTWDCSDAGLNPQFHDDVVKLLTESAFDWHIRYGYRTIAQQTRLYEIHLAGGPLAAPPGHSPHNFGLAVDVALIVHGKVQTRDDWDESHPGWQWLFTAVKAHPRLHSGVGFGDADHIERYYWTMFKDWNAPPPATA